MALSQRVLKELQKELKDLQSVQDAAGARIAALEMVLVNEAALKGRLRLSASKLRPGGEQRGMSLRAHVLKALGELPNRTPMDVTSHLEQIGFRVGGSTTLRERVAHEMSRLRRKGVIRRTGRQYELTTVMPTGIETAGRSPSQELRALN